MNRQPKHAFKGKLTGTFEQLYHAGCLQAGSDYDTLEEARRGVGRLYTVLHAATNGSPCDGCPRFEDGACLVYRRFHEDAIDAGKQVEADEAHVAEIEALKPKPIEKYPGMSLKKIAERLGVSKNEVQRRRDRGEL